jgi:hypothetical protein
MIGRFASLGVYRELFVLRDFQVCLAGGGSGPGRVSLGGLRAVLGVARSRALRRFHRPERRADHLGGNSRACWSAG